MRLLTAFVIAAIAFMSSASAGRQYIDDTRYAVSGYDVVAYFDLQHSAVGEPQAAAIPGRKEFTVEWNGATWAFASVQNRQRFLAEPTRYAPQYDGHCAYGVAQGGKVPGNPLLWRIVDGKLYLNITRTVAGFWEKDIPGYIKTGDRNWMKLDAQPASSGQVPSFDATNAPL